MRVLVTGGAGLIGMAVRDDLAAHGHEVTAIDITSFDRVDPELLILELTDHGRLDALMAERRIDAIVHCAAISGPMMAAGQPLLLVEINIDLTARLLDLARRHQVRRFVFCSSIGVYGNVGSATITEATRLRPTSVYGATKAACEQLVQAFAIEYGVDGVSLRISRVYGPYRRAHCHVGILLRNTLEGLPTAIPCNESFIYHYIYVADVAEAIRVALEAHALPSREYNVASAEALTMPRIVAIARAAVPDASIAMIPGADDVPDVQTAFSVERIANELGWQPRIDLAIGLKHYLDAMKAGRTSI